MRDNNLKHKKQWFWISSWLLRVGASAAIVLAHTSAPVGSMATSCLMRLLQRILIFLFKCCNKELYNSCLAEKHSITDGQTPKLIKRDDRRSLRNGVFSWDSTCWIHVASKAPHQLESEYWYVYTDKCMFVKILCMHQILGTKIRKETCVHIYLYGNKTEQHRMLLEVNVHIFSGHVKIFLRFDSVICLTSVDDCIVFFPKCSYFHRW